MSSIAVCAELGKVNRLLAIDEFWCHIAENVYYELTRADLGWNRPSTSPWVSQEVTEWGGPSDETGKTDALCRSRCGMIKIPSCSKAPSAEYRPKFCSLSPIMVMSAYKWKKKSRAGLEAINKQTDKQTIY
jgi:hypothetical protein